MCKIYFIHFRDGMVPKTCGEKKNKVDEVRQEVLRTF